MKINQNPKVHSSRIFYLIIRFLFVSIISASFFTDELYSEVKNYQDSCIQFSITTNKTEYLESEPVWLENFLVIPKGCEIDYEPIIFTGGTDDYKIVLINSSGDTMKCYCGNPVFDFKKEPQGDTNNHPLIFRGEHRDTIFYADNLLLSYGKHENFDNSGMILWNYLPADSYTICTILRFSSNRYYNYSISNTQSFEVKKSTGNETEARNLLLQIGKAFTSLKSIDFVNNIIKEFHSKHLNSVYSERINYYEIGGYKSPVSLLPEEEQTRILTEYIKSHPDDPYNYSYITGIESEFRNNKQKLKDLLIDLKTTCGNSISKFFIDEKLYELDKKNNK